MRAAVYCRVSSDKQNEASLDDQLHACEKLAALYGWTVTHRFRDHAISGSRRDRPDYTAMLNAAKTGDFDVLVVFNARED